MRPVRATIGWRAGIVAALLVVTGLSAPASAATLPTVGSAQELGPITQNGNILFNGAFVSGRDNGQSTGYDGHSVWIFNDTALTSNTLVSNTGAMTDDLDASNGLTLTSGSPFTSTDSGAPGAVVDLDSAEAAFQSAHNGGCGYPSDQ